jgi:two-component system, OmpR family, alkaline phosphatase synthesis response regulator PhoP
MDKLTKIAIVDDETNIRRLVSYDLKQAGYEVYAFEDGQALLDSPMVDAFDALVVDWMMPRLDGLSLVKAIRAKGNQALVIMLTAKAEEEDLIEAFEAGVDDYLSKPFSSRELLVRLKTHLNRLNTKGSDSLVLGDLTLHPIRRDVTLNDEPIYLTKVEFDLLQYLILERPNVLSRDQILNELWGFEYDGDTRIVDVHVSKLRSKLKASNLEIVSLRGVGYRIEVKS